MMQALKFLIFGGFASVWSLEIYIDGPVTLFDCNGENHGPQKVENTTPRLITEAPPVSKVVSCPASEGFYRPPNSTQCFKYDGRSLSWEDAKALCISQGMVLPQPHEDIIEPLTQYIRGIPAKPEFWLDGRGWHHGEGSDVAENQGVMMWERDNTTMPQDPELWYYEGAKYYVRSMRKYNERRCAQMMTKNYTYKKYYAAIKCKFEEPTLCEKVA